MIIHLYIHANRCSHTCTHMLTLMCSHICVHTLTHVFTHALTHAHDATHLHTHANTHVLIPHLHAHANIHSNTLTCSQLSIHMCSRRSHVLTYAHAYSHMCSHMHTWKASCPCCQVAAGTPTRTPWQLYPFVSPKLHQPSATPAGALTPGWPWGVTGRAPNCQGWREQGLLQRPRCPPDSAISGVRAEPLSAQPAPAPHQPCLLMVSPVTEDAAFGVRRSRF